MEIFKEFIVGAAHCLPNVPEGHKCSRLHEHSFKIKVYVTGKVEENFEWIIDFADIKKY